MHLTFLSILFLSLFSSFDNKTEWRPDQWKKAGTADSLPYLSQEEKEIIRYVNLARLYPKDFASIVVEDYQGIPERGYDLKNSSYKKSLLKKLRSMKATGVLQPDSLLRTDAFCFAEESGKNGLRGHERIKCPPLRASECVSYARNTGREIVLQLLIDHNVSSLGHRKICLDERYTKIGCAISAHKEFDHCAVLQFR